MAISALSVLAGVIVPQATAHAADYPSNYCTFTQSANKNTLTGSCTDEKNNGTFDDVNFRESGRDTFTFTDSFWTISGNIPTTSHDKPSAGSVPAGQTLRETRCEPATITFRNNEATISGQYASSKPVSGSFSTWGCTDLLKGKVTVTRELVRLTQWRETFYNNLLESLTALQCNNYNQGSDNYRECARGAATSIAGCVGPSGSIWTNTPSFEDKDEQKDAYRASARECLNGRLGRVSRAELTNAINQASASADTEENKIVDTEGEGDNGDGTVTTCAIDNIGWLVCPVLNFMAGIVDRAYGQVADWLKVTPLTTTTRSENGGVNTMYSAWSVMRNIANLAFVIGFMFIIYSQITSIGLSNYGIKKLLPKIIVAAILVNVSYWICSIAVDLSNILGSSLYKLFDAELFSQGISTSEFAGDISSTGNGWTAIVAALLASAAIWAALPALIVALPAALFAIVTVFLVLALRQVLIILLIVISPLAFVALLLPNTEDYFKKWRSLFQTLLLLYPIIAAIFGASALASTIVMNSATDINGDGKIAVQLMAALITVLPLAITPLVLKFSGGLLARFGGMINNPNKGPFDAMRKRTDALAGRMRNRRTASSIQRGQRFGEKVRSSQVGMRGAASSAYLQDRIKGDNDSKVRGWLADRYGKISSRASNSIEYAASMGATGKVDAAERDKYAKVAADSAARNYVAERAVDSKAYATSLAGGNPGVATLVQAYGKQAVHEEDVKDVKAQRVLIDGYNIEQLLERAQDDKATVSERAAAIQEIAERGGHQHVQEMYDYLMTANNKNMANYDANAGEIQKLSAEALLRRKPAGMSATNANNMKSGAMTGDGFMNEFQYRIEARKFSAEALSKMDLDDHIRIAEMASRNELSDEALALIQSQLLEISQSDTMKLSPEQTEILEKATHRQMALNPSGNPYSLRNTLPVRPRSNP